MEACWKEGRRHAVDCDLKSFFDTVNHDRLMGQLREKIRDRKGAGSDPPLPEAGVVLPDGTREATPQGVPQGGPLSPLLANITLDPLDKELEAADISFARYADDFLVMVKSAKAAERVMASLTRFVRRTAANWWSTGPKAKPRRSNNVPFWDSRSATMGQRCGRPRRSTLQAAGERNHPPQPGTQCAGRHRRTAPIRHRLAQLLRDQLTPTRRCWNWMNGSGEECGCTTGSNGSSPGLAAAICWHWGSTPRKCTWPREAAKGTGG